MRHRILEFQATSKARTNSGVLQDHDDVALATKRGDVAVGPVQLLAAGQAPGSAYYRAGLAADPEPGGALAAMDAELVGARRHARHDQHSRPSDCSSWLAGGCGR